VFFGRVGRFEPQGSADIEPGGWEARVFDMLGNESEDFLLPGGKRFHL
jgi:hypothetical protein